MMDEEKQAKRREFIKDMDAEMKDPDFQAGLRGEGSALCVLEADRTPEQRAHLDRMSALTKRARELL